MIAWPVVLRVIGRISEPHMQMIHVVYLTEGRQITESQARVELARAKQDAWRKMADASAQEWQDQLTD